MNVPILNLDLSSTKTRTRQTVKFKLIDGCCVRISEPLVT